MHLSKVVWALITLLPITLCQDTRLATVQEAFRSASIPADADLTFQPSILLEVVFPQATGRPVRVSAGVRLPRNATAIPPKFAIRGSNGVGGDNFVVAMVDLDAPTPQAPTNAQIRHFLGGNFHPVSTRREQVKRLLNSTAAISEFRQPTPPAGSDPHRYVFFLFNQPRGFDQQTLVNSTTSISDFNISAFASEVGLGNPVGGTFILVGPDPPSA